MYRNPINSLSRQALTMLVCGGLALAACGGPSAPSPELGRQPATAETAVQAADLSAAAPSALDPSAPDATVLDASVLDASVPDACSQEIITTTDDEVAQQAPAPPGSDEIDEMLHAAELTFELEPDCEFLPLEAQACRVVWILEAIDPLVLFEAGATPAQQARAADIGIELVEDLGAGLEKFASLNQELAVAISALDDGATPDEEAVIAELLVARTDPEILAALDSATGICVTTLFAS